MRNDQPAASTLFAFGCESGLSESEIRLEKDKWENLHGAHLQKQLQTALILSVTFI
jgi:16S rRNA U1498 N3-methylase RsmE